MNLDIPENAKQFQLKSYAGEQTWGDEVVYADAKFTASGTFQKPGEWVPAQKRREISNEHPLMIIRYMRMVRNMSGENMDSGVTIR